MVDLALTLDSILTGDDSNSSFILPFAAFRVGNDDKDKVVKTTKFRRGHSHFLLSIKSEMYSFS